LTDQVVDLVEGRADLSEKKLRVVDPSRFGEDPLRALRAVRFSASLGFSPDEELVALCQSMDLRSEPVERVWGELRRTLLSQNPDRGLEALHRFRQLHVVLPEVHPERLPEIVAALRCSVPLRNSLADSAGALSVMLGVLLHFVEPDRRGELLARFKISRPGGVPVRKFTLALGRFLPLNNPPRDSELRHLAEVGPMSWILAVASAVDPALDSRALSRRCDELGVSGGPLPSLLRGPDLQEAGISPGPQMGRIMQALRKVQLDGGLSNREEALDWLVAHIASSPKA
jgi:tRNA nucleotidyltransferase/poly(A) polymerase